MTPEQFLTLTAKPEKRARVMAEVSSRPEHIYGQGNPFCLGVDINTGKVIYHDGRHRAAQALLRGDQEVPVQVRLHDASIRLTDEQMSERHRSGMDFHCAVWGDTLDGQVSGLICQRSDKVIDITVRGVMV